MGLDIPKVDHSLLTKDSYGRPHPLNNKKEKLIDIFKEIRGDDELSVEKKILLDHMQKYPLMFGTKVDSEIWRWHSGPPRHSGQVAHSATATRYWWQWRSDIYFFHQS